jgi:drug/metabolite transporter (DMT)-like permease
MSIVFAAFIGVLFLKEQMGRLRLTSVLLVCLGAVAIKLA